MKSIVIREIDRYTSQTYKDKIISEYLIYLYYNDVKLECYTEIGTDAKNIRVNEIILFHLPIKEITEINLDDDKFIINHE